MVLFFSLQSPTEEMLQDHKLLPIKFLSMVAGRTSVCCFLLLLRPGDHQLGSLSMERGIGTKQWGNPAKVLTFFTPET